MFPRSIVFFDIYAPQKIWRFDTQILSELRKVLLMSSGQEVLPLTVNRRSTSAYVFFLANRLISWSSQRQRTVAASSCEAKYIAQCSAAKEAVWLRLLLSEVGYGSHDSTLIHANNKSAIAIGTNPEYHARTKHIDIQYHYVI